LYYGNFIGAYSALHELEPHSSPYSTNTPHKFTHFEHAMAIYLFSCIHSHLWHNIIMINTFIMPTYDTLINMPWNMQYIHMKLTHTYIQTYTHCRYTSTNIYYSYSYTPTTHTSCMYIHIKRTHAHILTIQCASNHFIHTYTYHAHTPIHNHYCTSHKFIHSYVMYNDTYGTYTYALKTTDESIRL